MIERDGTKTLVKGREKAVFEKPNAMG